MRLCLIESGLIWTRVDCEKRVTLLHIRAVLKMARDDLPAHLRLHLHGLVRRASADFVKINRHIFCHHLSNQSRPRWRLSTFNLDCRTLNDTVTNKRCQNDKKKVRPLRNLIASTTAFHLNLGPLESAAV